MKFLKRILILTLFLGFLVTPLQAQKNKDKAEEVYDNLGYKASIPLFESKKSMNMKEMSKLANAYRLIHDTENAEFWYGQFVNESAVPQHTLHYAQALQSNGRFDLAKEYYMKYDEMVGSEEGTDKRGALLAAAIERMNEIKHSNEAKIKNETLINTDRLDFSPAFYKNGIIFVSTRGAQSTKHENMKDNWINDNFMALFYADKNMDGELTSVKEFSVDLTTKFHEGPVCFTKNGSRIFFTRNDYLNKKRRNNSKGTMKLQIYSSIQVEGGWSEPKELSFNTLEHDEAHPTVSSDGTKLYFASDRPGGYGGVDLYVSEFANGRWSKPENLGESVNTAGNEAFPFIHDDGTLYFSSDGWGGLGGMDIFSSVQNEEEWTKASNIGTPFNSGKDDFGFILNVLKTEGYFTSARANGIGRDDVYSFVMPQNAPVKVNICAYEEESQNRITDVQFEIVEQFKDNATASIDGESEMVLEKSSNANEYVLKFKQKGIDFSNSNSIKLFNTNEDGEFQTYFKNNKDYLIIASKDGYKIAEESFDGAMLQGKDMHDLCVPLKKMRCVNIDGVVEHKKFGKAIPGAKITMTNLCTGDDEVVEANEKGYFIFPCVECGCDYILKSEKAHFNDGMVKQSIASGDCILGTTVSSEILMDNQEKLNAMFANTALEEGAIIEMENIYYDFNESYIRPDAKGELDNIVRLMQTYPSLMIELSSHTDARASDDYNDQLSQNRANAAVDYIASRGITRQRLIAVGYGERQLKNYCADGVSCSEEEHQRNRRTEIKVLEFDRSDVKVHYIDNDPKRIDSAHSYGKD